MSTYNLSKALLNSVASIGETIEAVVVGPHDGFGRGAPRVDENVVLSAEEGLAKLDEDYDNGYGGADCYPFWAWTQTRVYFVTEYDGATGLSWIPRHPVAGTPSFSGEP